MERYVKRVEVAPERLAGWIERFAAQHGGLVSPADAVELVAADGAQALITEPFPPRPADLSLIEHALVPRNVGAVLVRRGGHAVGAFAGAALVASKVGRNYVQSRTKAGGWSQQRYARRRANQATQAFADAADDAFRVLLPRAGELDFVVGGGDRTGVIAVLDDPRLRPLRELWTGDVWPTPDPRLDVLRDFARSIRAVRIDLDEQAITVDPDRR